MCAVSVWWSSYSTQTAVRVDEICWQHDQLAAAKFLKVHCVGQSSRRKCPYCWRSQISKLAVLTLVCEQEMGVPQGSILSVTLFCLKINSIVKALCPGVDCSLYVDDFLICYRSKYIHIIERHLQRCLNKLQEWADANGFKFSTSKTVCVHFCRLRKHHLDPELFLYGMPILRIQRH